MSSKTLSQKRISVKSFAKVNLALDVLKKENTHHRILTVLQQIDLHDTIIFQIREPHEIRLVCSNPEVPINDTNTILRAVNLLKKYAASGPGLKKRITGLHIRLIKRIPVASGLGGGSSNAAVTLAALNRLWKLNIPEAKLSSLGASIGMDVPFFLKGGTALGEHFGEKIKPLPGLKNLHLLIALPSVKKISTQKIYGELDLSKTGKRGDDTSKLVRLIRTLHLSKSDLFLSVGAFCHNDFDTVKSLQQSKIRALRKNMLRTAPLLVQSCGSGMAQMALYNSRRARAQAHRELKGSGLFLWQS